MDTILLGQADLHRMVMAGVLSQGHILLEGLPGVGKTALIKALGQVLNLQFSRVQFTPDLMPGDIIGASILQETQGGQRKLIFEKGPVFTNILLADEINRASPKTQSALLEAMQERSVTSLGVTRKLPLPFFVLASQNPIELEGTYPLPEAQLDRFMFKLKVSGVDVATLQRIISTRRRGEPPVPTWTMSPEQLDSILEIMDQIVLPEAVTRYIARLVAATHANSSEATQQVKKYLSYGASPRAAIAMSEAARAFALLDGRPTVGFEDVKAVAPGVLNHRLILNYQAKFDQVTTDDVVKDLMADMDVTGLNLPGDMKVDANS